jgi:DNA-binding transcriptional ArsR family regulator
MSLEVSPYLRALAHPLRLRVLSLLTGAAMSAAEVARELDVTHANASYHLRQLLGAGLVEVAEERVTRGGQERLYRPTPFSTHPQTDDRTLLAAAMAEELKRRSALADLSARGGATADAELWVTPEVYAEVGEQVRAAMVLLHEKARPLRAEGSVRVSATVSLFQMTA